MPTFLLTDIEGSTRLWETHPEIMAKALAHHNSIIAGQLERFGGKLIKNTGDGVFAVFEGGDPIQCALKIQKEIQKTVWGPIKELRIRAVVHSGPAKKMGDDYFGPVINRTARIMSLGWGGQILLTPEAANEHALPAGAVLKDLGTHALKGLSKPQQVLGLDHPELPLREFPPLRGQEHVLASHTTATIEKQVVMDIAAAAGIAVDSAPAGVRKPAGPAKLADTFDQTHLFVQKAVVGGRGKNDGQFMLPAGVAVDAMGRVYVSDAIQSAVQIFDAHGKFVRRLGYEGGLLETGLKFNNPSALATDHAGRIYACDTKNCRIVVFDLQGEVILAFGRPLVVVSVSEPHGMIGFNYPRGLALDEKEKLLYVADTGNHRLRLFDTAGQPVQTFGSRGEQPGEFMLPIGLAVGRSGRLYVADSENYRVQVFDRGFKFSHSFGRRGASPGEFHHQPVAVAVSPEDDVIVCDGTDRMKVFSHDGRYAGGVSGRKLATAVPKYSAAALYGMDNLFAIDENGCQWHHFVYTEITE